MRALNQRERLIAVTTFIVSLMLVASAINRTVSKNTQALHDEVEVMDEELARARAKVQAFRKPDAVEPG